MEFFFLRSAFIYDYMFSPWYDMNFFFLYDTFGFLLLLVFVRTL